MNSVHAKLASVLGFVLSFGSVLAADPPAAPIGWRTDATGCYPDATPPTKWSASENIRWKTAMPGKSFGSPIVVGERIFVASDPAELLCVNAADGQIVWRRTCSAAEALGEEQAQKNRAAWSDLNDRRNKLQRQFGDLRKEKPDAKDEHDKLQAEIRTLESEISLAKRKMPVETDRGSGNTAATPVCDGKLVYAAFGSGIVAACTLDGEPRWTKFIEGSDIGFGHASSPLLVEGKLIVHFHDLVALNAGTGDIAWRTELEARHASPIAVRIGTEAALVSPAGSVIRASDGKLLTSDPALRLSEGSAVASDGVLYSQGDKTTFRLPTSFAGEKLESLWQATASRGRRTPSPVVHGGLLYGVNTDGILDVTDTETGDVLYRKRLELDGGIYASVTAAGDFIFISSTKGTTIVLKAGEEYEEIARNDLESLGASLVFAGSRLYFRGHKHLYCIE